MRKQTCAGTFAAMVLAIALALGATPSMARAEEAGASAQGETAAVEAADAPSGEESGAAPAETVGPAGESGAAPAEMAGPAGESGVTAGSDVPDGELLAQDAEENSQDSSAAGAEEYADDVLIEYYDVEDMQLVAQGTSTYDAYARLIDQASKLEGVFARDDKFQAWAKHYPRSLTEYLWYTLFDIGADGVPELLIRQSGGGFSYAYVFTVRNGESVYLGDYTCDDATYGNSKGECYQITSQYENKVDKLDISSGSLNLVRVFDGGYDRYSYTSKYLVGRKKVESYLYSLGAKKLEWSRYSDLGLLRRITGSTGRFHEDFEGALTRYWGDGALDTMQAIVRADGAFASGRGGSVVVATAGGYWDALSASGLAGCLDAPVLVTDGGSLSEQTRMELERLRPSRVVVMGGELAVSPSCYQQIASICGNVSRVWGAGAPDTAVEAYKTGSGWGTTAVVATSSGYWDALSIAPYAWAKHAPIFLTGGDGRLGASALAAIKAGGFTRVVITGGPLAVSSAVEGQLAGVGLKGNSVIRLWGAGAVDTSAAIAKWEASEGMGASHLAVATANGYWDALCGAAVAGKQNSALVLVGVSGNGRFTAIDAAYGVGRPEHVHVLGGQLAVSPDTWSHLKGK